MTGLSRSTFHTHLRELVEEKSIEKIGSTPQTYHTLRIKTDTDTINEHFVFQDALGKLHTGIEGFKLWSERGYSVERVS